MIVKLLTEHHLEFLSLKGGCTGSSEYTIVKVPHCWKSHDTAHILRVLSFSQRQLFQVSTTCFSKYRSLTLFSAIHINCGLLSLLGITLVAYIANNIPRSDCSWGCLILVHNACFHVKTSLKCICIYAVGIKSRWHFLDKKYQQDI